MRKLWYFLGAFGICAVIWIGMALIVYHIIKGN